MEPTIYRYVIKYSLRQQVILTLMAISSYPFLLGFLNVPKWIINHIKDAIDKICENYGDDYWLETDRTGTFPEDFVKEFVDGGWLGIAMPEEYGSTPIKALAKLS